MSQAELTEREAEWQEQEEAGRREEEVLQREAEAAKVVREREEAKGEVEEVYWSLQCLASQIDAPAAKGAAEPGSPPDFAPEGGIDLPSMRSHVSCLC